MQTPEKLPPQTSIDVTSPTGAHASFLRRASAIMIDGVLLSIVQMALQQTVAKSGSVNVQMSSGSAIGFFLAIGYYIVMLVKHDGQTIGKQLMHIRVVTEDRTPITWMTAGIRYLVSLLSSAVFGLGYLWMLGNGKKQTWHDLLAHTEVVETEGKPHGCLVFFGCFLPILFSVFLVAAFAVGFLSAIKPENLEKLKTMVTTGSVSSLKTPPTPTVAPELQKHLDRSKELFTQMKASKDIPAIKKLNDENISELKKALELDPKNAALWDTLGSAYTWWSTAGTLQDGLDAYGKAEELAPTDVRYIANAANMLYRMNRYDDAILEAKRALRVNDNSAYAHFVLAQSYAASKLPSQASDEYQKAIDIWDKLNADGKFDEELLQAQKEQAALKK
jgi:uncharacterized RDD family membrane protein YckC/cytochrome c-type biogenesis protein CcmH/NrfG